MIVVRQINTLIDIIVTYKWERTQDQFFQDLLFDLCWRASQEEMTEVLSKSLLKNMVVVFCGMCGGGITLNQFNETLWWFLWFVIKICTFMMAYVINSRMLA